MRVNCIYYGNYTPCCNEFGAITVKISSLNDDPKMIYATKLGPLSVGDVAHLLRGEIKITFPISVNIFK